MVKNYEISSETLFIISVNDNTSRVIEKSNKFIVNKKSLDIIKDSCLYFGSTYEGRYKCAKELLEINYKIPIIIEESNDIVFFPTQSPKNKDCIWINLKEIKKVVKLNKKTRITFKNDDYYIFNISYGIIENQILRANLLKSILLERKQLK